MKTYKEIVDVRDGSDWKELTINVNVPSPKELQAANECLSGGYVVTVTNLGNMFAVSLFKKGELEKVYGKGYSDMSRKDAVTVAAEWIAEW